MYLFISGEGKSDIGYCKNQAGICEIPDFEPRAMTIIADKLIESYLGYDYSLIEYEQITFVHKKHLKGMANKKTATFRSVKTKADTSLYFHNSRALATVAKEKHRELNQPVIAILFRDSDGTNTTDKADWEAKRNSMNRGFESESFYTGVAMIPKPKSEAWLLCAVKDSPYQHCHQLEAESGNDNSPNPLKSQLSQAMDKYEPKTIEDLLNEGIVDIHQIDMPSFHAFKADLKKAIESC